MELKFTISGRIARPVAEVFEAVADPARLSRYFTTGGARGRLETGATVMWDFADFPGAFPVRVIRAVPPSEIVLEWDADPGDGAPPYPTTVTLRFAPLEENARTLVSISEEGWKPDAAGLKSSYGNCEGWTGMLCAMKVFLEHGITLREGFYS